MLSCGASSVGLGRGRSVRSPPWRMKSSFEVLTLDSETQVQRKVVVCGDGACGELYLLVVIVILLNWLHTLDRQDFVAERLHEGFLHPSIVRPPDQSHSFEPPDSNHVS